METIIEILIDNSGSMGYMKGSKEHENEYLIDGQTRMTLIKKVLTEEVIPTIDFATEVIIRTFRVNSKNVGDKKLDEIAIPSIFEGFFDKEKILAVITSLEDPPGGGTPITAAINTAVLDLIKYPTFDRKIILLTDGEENGVGDYKVAAQKALEMEGIPCKIFIIGIAQDDESSNKSKEIAKDGYYNINSMSFHKNELKKVLAPLKTVVLLNTIQNIRSETSSPTSKQQDQQVNIIQTVENKIEKINQENKQDVTDQLVNLEKQIHTQIINSQKLLDEISTLKELFRLNSLFDTEIDSTSLTIDIDYSERIRRKSESFLFSFLCQKYGVTRVRWLNENKESFSHHDFELLDEVGKTIQIIECKGTSIDKPTFYLTSEEWNHFLKNKEIYQLYRVFKVEGDIKLVCIENLFNAILNREVVPYLLSEYSGQCVQ
jgi:hypothetical protein